MLLSSIPFYYGFYLVGKGGMIPLEKVKIFDTTLRDGAQTSGVCFETREKVEIAENLAKMKVDIIEAGFPVASKSDFQAVEEISRSIHTATIAALARANQKDIDIATQALGKRENGRIHTFLATSDIQLAHKLKMSRAQVMAHAQEAVRYAKQFMEDVEFTAEDASRSDWDFLCQVYNGVIAAGATTINITDTVGYATPEEFGNLVKYIKEHVHEIEKVAVGVHCHNDLGMATANSLAGILGGAGQVECTINGLGERAGNASMEEIVMALATRNEYYKKITNIDTRQIYRTSRLVSALSGIVVSPNKAIVGDNAFIHVAGGHQHSVVNHAPTFEIMRPESIGISRNTMVLNKLTGRQMFEERVAHLGYELKNDMLNHLFVQFKELAGRKKLVYDRDIEALINSKKQQIRQHYRLLCHSILSGTGSMATASARLETTTGDILEEASCGDGPVDALFKAIKKAIGREFRLKDYQLKAVTSGQDALGEATVWVEEENIVYSGRGLSTDVLEATAKAYVNAINKLISGNGDMEKQQS